MKTLKVTEWQDELKAALEYREQFAKEQYWDRLEKGFYNDAQSDTALGPNIVFSEGDTLISGLTVPHPEFVVGPDDPMSVRTAPVVQALQNRLAKRENLNIKSSVEDACLNSYLYNKAIIKIGYDSEFGWSPAWDAGSLQNPWGQTFTQFDKKGHRIEFNAYQPGYPWVAPVLPHDFLVPWGTLDDVETAPWIAFRIVRETEHFKSDPKYKNTSRLTPQLSAEDFTKSYNFENKKYRTQYSSTGTHRQKNVLMYNEAWEIHDKRTGRIYVVTFDHDKFLRDDPSALMGVLGQYPVVTASFVKHAHSFWCTPLAYYLGSHQAEIFDLAIQAAKQRRINVAKFLMMEGAMSNAELEKLISGDVGAFAKVKQSAGKSLKDVFLSFPRTSNLDVHAEAEAIRRDAREVMGASRNQSGEFDASSRRTATETVAVQRGYDRRQVKKEDVVRELYGEAMRKCTVLTFAFWSRPRDILVGDEWQRFTGAQLKGRYSYQVDLLNREVMSSAQRKMEALQMLLMLAQYPNANIQELEKYVIAAANDPSFEGFFIDRQQNQQRALPAGASQAGGVGQANVNSKPQMTSGMPGRGGNDAGV